MWTLQYDLGELLPALGGQEWGEPGAGGTGRCTSSTPWPSGWRSPAAPRPHLPRPGPPTADTTATVVWGLQSSAMRRWPRIVPASVETVDATSDYGMNLCTLLAGG